MGFRARIAAAGGLLALASCLLGAGPAGAAPNPSTVVPVGSISALATDAAGRTYLGGTFSGFGPRTGRGLALTASDDHFAAGFPDVAGTISAVAPDGAGGWFIGGSFSAVGGVERHRLAHILASGALDPDWDPDVTGAAVKAIAVADGDVYFGGSFSAVGSGLGAQARTNIARASASGAGVVDADWNPCADGTVSALAVGGGELYVGGAFTAVNGVDASTCDGAGTVTRGRIARIALSDATGRVDADWDPCADGAVSAIAVDDDEVYFGGDFTAVNGAADCAGAGAVVRSRIARIASSDATGRVDADWDPCADGAVSAIAVDDDEVYFGGDFTAVNGANPSTCDGAGTVARNRIARIARADATGRVDGGWDPVASGPVHAIALAGGTSVYAGGAFEAIGGESRSGLAQLTTTGTGTATGWNPGPAGPAAAVDAIGVAGSDVYAGGSFVTAGEITPRSNLARLNADGTLDTTWNPNVSGAVHALLVSGTGADEAVYAGGAFTTVGGVGHVGAAKILTATPDGEPEAWDPQITPFGCPDWCGTSVSALAASASGASIYLGGNFARVGGSARIELARVSASDAALDVAWDAQLGGLAGNLFGVRSIVVDADHVYYGGLFAPITSGENVPYRVGRSSTDAADSAFDNSWNPNLGAGTTGQQTDFYAVNSLAVTGGYLYLGGNFTSVGNTDIADTTGQADSGAWTGGHDSPHNLARIAVADNAAGQVDDGWTPDPTPATSATSVDAIVPLDANTILVGGDFTAIGSAPAARAGVARVATNDAGSVGAWDPRPSAGADAFAVSRSTAWIGGGFGSVGGLSTNGLAQVDLEPGQLRVVAELDPAADPGAFDLQINGTTVTAGAADGGDTGLRPVYGVENTVGETAGAGTSLDDYDVAIVCRALDGAGATVASGAGGGPLSVPVGAGEQVRCTITNTRLVATATAVVASPTPANPGQPVTYTATVAPVPSGGTVDVSVDGAIPVACQQRPASTTTGIATCSAPAPAKAGAHPVAATYSGHHVHLPSTGHATLNVRTPTAIVLIATPEAPGAGAPVTFSAWVTPSPAGGAVTFTRDGQPISAACTTVAVTIGLATCTAVAPGAAGVHTLRAAYSGSAGFTTSTAAAQLKVQGSPPPPPPPPPAGGGLPTAGLGAAPLPAQPAKPAKPAGPVPVPGKWVMPSRLKGVVLVGGKRLDPARPIPLGTIVDATEGEVTLRLGTGASVEAAAGTFKITQVALRTNAAAAADTKRWAATPAAKRFQTTLVLAGGDLRPCARAVPGSTQATRTRRALTVTGTGAIASRGRFASASVRGTGAATPGSASARVAGAATAGVRGAGGATIGTAAVRSAGAATWVMRDRCDGTLTVVKRGTVSIADRVRGGTTIVRVGRRHLSRP